VYSQASPPSGCRIEPSTRSGEKVDSGRSAAADTRIDGVVLPMAGRHNVQNALAAIAVATELAIPDAAILKALAEFSGVGRRFQRHGDVALPGGGRFTLIDDYGHHPAEIAATLDAARGAFPGRRLVLAFQPHRYTRTRDLFEDFVPALSGADVLLLDAFDDGKSVKALATQAFYEACRKALRSRGVMVVNFISEERGFGKYLGRIEDAFDGRVLCLPAQDRVNMIVLAFKSGPARVAIESLKASARVLKRRYGLPFDRFVTDLLDHNTRTTAYLRVARP